MSLIDLTEYGYDVGKLVASGSDGQVLKGTDLETGDTVAIKYAKGWSDARDNLKREIEALSNMSNSFVPRLYSHGEVDDRPYIVMEYIEGKTFQNSSMDVEQTIDAMIQLGQAICAVREDGFRHSDLHLGNVMLDKKSNVRLIDFSRSRPLSVEPNYGIDNDMFGWYHVYRAIIYDWSMTDEDRYENLLTRSDKTTEPEEVVKRFINAKENLQ